MQSRHIPSNIAIQISDRYKKTRHVFLSIFMSFLKDFVPILQNLKYFFMILSSQSKWLFKCTKIWYKNEIIGFYNVSQKSIPPQSRIASKMRAKRAWTRVIS